MKNFFGDIYRVIGENVVCIPDICQFCINLQHNSQNWPKEANISRSLCQKGHRQEESTPPPVVAVVTNISFGGVGLGFI